MKKTWQRILTAFLAVLMMSSVLVACGSDEGETSTTTTQQAGGNVTTAVTEVTTVDEKKQYDPQLEADDWKQGQFNILYNGSDVEPNHDFTATELNGNVLNDAIYNRNLMIQDKYNLVINAKYSDESGISSAVANSNRAGDDSVQLAESNGAYSMSMTLNGSLYDLAELENINLEKPYWNSLILAGSSIGGKNYFALSDACIHAYGATPCSLFNKQILADFNLGDIYQIVTDGKWTYEVMSQMIQTVTGDLDGDGQITKDDRLGYIANNFCVDCFVSGSGYMMIAKDENDLPYLNMQNEKFYNIIDGIKSLCAEENGAFIVDRTSTATEAREYWTEEAFTADRALFVGGNLKWAERLRAMENDFGIVPIPKADEDQENYAIHIQANVGAYQGVPSGVLHPDMVSKVLEEIAYQSYLTVTPAYYNIVLEGQSVRDEESIVTLNVIRNAYYCDLGFMLGNLGIGILGQMRTVVTNNKDCASILKQVQKVYDASIKKIRSNY